MHDSLVKDRTIPEAAQNRMPSWIQCIREKYHFPADWDFKVCSAKGKVGGEYFEVTGAVYETEFKRGPRKGEINFQKPEPGTECTVVLPKIEYQEWLEKWELDTGFCSQCSGSGFTLASGGASGTFYRKCNKCGGSGRVAREVAAIP